MSKRQILAAMGVLLGLLVLTAGLSTAQGPAGEPTGAEGDLALTAMVDSTISYQGMLTDNGNPVSGSRTMVFRLFSDSGCTAQVGADINAGSVQVSEGYFDVDLPVGHDDFDGQALWIEVEVDTTEIGCEPIRPVPYALSLKPLATISGDPGPGEAVLTVSDPPLSRAEFSRNVALGTIGVYGEADIDTFLAAGVHGLAEGDGSLQYGVWGQASSLSGRGVFGEATSSGGTNYGVYGSTNSPNGYGGYFTNDESDGVALMAGGSGIFESTADTIIGANALDAVVYYDDLGDIDLLFSPGTVDVRPNATGYAWVFVPVDVPTMLFGTPTKLKSARICYRCDDAADIITWTGVRARRDTGSVDLVTSATDRASTSWGCFDLTPGTPVDMDGPVIFRIQLDFAGTGSSHDIQLGKLSVTLTES
jgi:hypothetical protein